jgi:hypothetical protein
MGTPRLAGAKRALGVGKRPRLGRDEAKLRLPDSAIQCAANAEGDAGAFGRALARLARGRSALVTRDIGRRGLPQHGNSPRQPLAAPDTGV